MFTVVRGTNRLSLDERFVRRPAATFFAVVEGDGMAGRGLFDGDILIVDRSLTPHPGSIVVAVLDGELTVRPFASVVGEDAILWGVARGLVRDLP